MSEIRTSLGQVTRLSVEEFVEAQPDLVHRTFGPKLNDDLTLRVLEPDLFPQAGWQCFLLPLTTENLDHRYLIDTHSNMGEFPAHLTPINWCELLLFAHWQRGGGMIYKAKTGYFVNPKARFADSEYVCRIVPRSDAINGARLSSSAGFFSNILFDAGGSWGLIDVEDQEISLLGADSTMSTYLVHAFGGLDRMQRRFGERLRRWSTPTTANNTSVNEHLLAKYRPIYDRIGWPWPFPDHIGKEPYES